MYFNLFKLNRKFKIEKSLGLLTIMTLFIEFNISVSIKPQKLSIKSKGTFFY